jgi:16S rRNA (guanine527-N7)-methyltransferase
VLERSKALGFLGPGPIEAHAANASAFAAAASGPPTYALDLGSGGGVPGLVLAVHWQSSRWMLLDSMRRRCAFLREAAAELDLGDRVSIIEERAEVAGRDAGLRARFDLVTARSFARPAVTAECAAPLLMVGGALLVSEPPEPQEGERWRGIGELGLVDDGLGPAAAAHIRRFVQRELCAGRYPRRTGIPDKRPLW